MKNEPDQIEKDGAVSDSIEQNQQAVTLPSLLVQFVQEGGAANILELINQFDTEEVIRTIQELMGADVSLLNLIATLNFQLKNYDYILPYLHTANQSAPENQDTLYNLGLFLHMINETELAVYYLRQIQSPDAEVLDILSSVESAKPSFDHREHALRYLQAKQFTPESDQTEAPNTVQERRQKLDRVLSLIQSGKLEAARLAAYNELQKNPTDAQWWMYLGEALNAQGQKAAAWKAYDRAWLLDPQATWVDEVKKEVAAARSGKIPKWLTDLLHVPTVTVTAAMIVKNEERFIGDSIRALLPAVDEIVVVDTGSTDRTVEIATELGAKVFHFEWNDDFAAARNFGLDQVTSDWVLWVDADEILSPEDVEAPRTVAGLFDHETTPRIICITINNQILHHVVPIYDVPRLFATRFGMRFWRRIHEQIVLPSEGGMTLMKYSLTARIRFRHEGYQPSVIQDKNKMQRNIQLLTRSIEDDPDDLSAWGFLGKELYSYKQYEEAIRIFTHTEQLAQQKESERFSYGRLKEVRLLLARALEKSQRYDEVPEVLDRLVRDSPEFPDGWYELGNAKLREVKRLLQEAGEAFLEAHQRSPKYRGLVLSDAQIGQWKASAQLAEVHLLQGDLVQATKLYESVLEVASSKEEVHAHLDKIKKQVGELSKHFK